MKLKELFSEKVLTIANFLTLLRVLLLPVSGYFLYLEKITGFEYYKYLTFLTVILIILTDFLDGYLARLFNQVSKLGQFMDPIADKIAATTGMILLYIFRDFPLWVIIIMLARDMYSIIGGIFIFSKKDIQVEPNFYGKMMVTCLGAAALIFIISPSFNFYGLTLQRISIFLFLFFLIVSSILYWKSYSRVYFENKS